MASEEIIDWNEEAKGIIKDIKKHVKNIEISDKLINDGSNIFLNITLLEDKKLTVLLDKLGFRIVSFTQLDSCDDEQDEHYETIYSLLQAHSPEYIKSFGNTLAHELEKLVQ